MNNMDKQIEKKERKMEHTEKDKEVKEQKKENEQTDKTKIRTVRDWITNFARAFNLNFVQKKKIV
jgi:hypothetical protein